MSNQGLIGLEILVVDSDPQVMEGLKKLLGEEGFVVTGCNDLKGGVSWLDKKFFAVVICDLDTPNPNDGLKIVTAAKELSPATAIIVLTPRRDYAAAVNAFRARADDVVAKSPDQVSYLVEKVKNTTREHRRNADRRELLHSMIQAHEKFLDLMMSLFKKNMDMQDRLQGRDSTSLSSLSKCTVLVVDPDPELPQVIQGGLDKEKNWELIQCQMGGEALDHIGRRIHHIVLVNKDLPDLPSTMVTRTVKSQSPESIVLEYVAPGAEAGKIQVMENSGPIALVDEYTKPEQMIESLQTLREAFSAKAKERRYLQAFRANHYEFLKQYAELKNRLTLLATDE